MGVAAKVAGEGIFNTSFRRGVQVIPPSAEHPITRVSAIALSSGEVSSVADMTASAKHSVSREMMNDWEFNGGVEEEVAPVGSIHVSGGGEPIARLLFGGVPSLEETKEATTDLKDALKVLYLSSPKSTNTAQVSCLSNPEETKYCVARNVKPAMQAFKLLNESPAVQSVVASVAADQKVWDAVINNPAYMEFIHSLKTNDEFEDSSRSSESSVATEEFFDATQPKDSGNPASGFLKNIKTGVAKMVSTVKSIKTSVANKTVSTVKDTKTSVIEMVTKATDFIENLFTPPSAGIYNHCASPSAEKEKENAGSNNIIVEKTIGATIMGLVVMVVMVVLMKRV